MAGNSNGRCKQSLLLVICFFSCCFYMLLLLCIRREGSSVLPVVHSRLHSHHYHNLVLETGTPDRCQGQRVYAYELPLQFNNGLLEKCAKGLVSWLDFCPHLANFGFGKVVRWSGGDENGSGSGSMKGWYGTDAYMLEVIFHSRIQSYVCLTADPSQADAFFVPYYAGLDALRYLYREKKLADDDRHGEQLMKYLESKDTWKRCNGRDHFMVMGRTSWDFDSGGWGTGILELPQVKNMTTIFIERLPWSKNQVAVPYPTGFHPANAEQLQEWIRRVRSSRRTYLFAFSGGIRPTMGETIRDELLRQCSRTSRCARVDCGKLRCGHDPRPSSGKFLRSQFCLQPRGDTPTRRSTFDALIAGCIPVFFHQDSADTQYIWHLPSEPRSYSVLIPEESLRGPAAASIEEVLGSLPDEQVMQMRESIIEVIPRLVYAAPGAVAGDAFDTSLRAVMNKVAEAKRS